ncbi:MAG: glycine oxidase ThiO [Isosphaeraceae bacterium]
MAADVVVIGGGVIGLSVAYRLATEGVLCTVLDRGELGRQASWAGAGLIPAQGERAGSHPPADLRSWSASLYPEWSAALLEETGVDNGYRRTGGVDVGLSSEEADQLRTMAGRWRAEGIVFEKLAQGDFNRVEPALGPAVTVAYFLPDRAQVRNPRHLQALIRSLTMRGVTLRPGRGALGFETKEGRVTGVKTADGTLACGAIVMAAGAWSGALLGGLGVDAPTPPVKGQIVLLRSERPLLKRIVEHGSHYLVPRDDGRILVGATEEHSGFDVRPTALGVRELLDEALMVCPRLAEAEVERAWAGLRPGSVDTRPYLGPIPGYVNAFVAAGHKRAGLQLSTGTAEVIADLVLGRPPRIDPTPYRIGREPSVDSDEPFRS